jgi:hypothetical protein
MNSSVNWSTNFIGGDVMSEGDAESPTQAELRPTCAGAFQVILPCGVTPHEFLSQLVDQFHRG